MIFLVGDYVEGKLAIKNLKAGVGYRTLENNDCAEVVNADSTLN